MAYPGREGPSNQLLLSTNQFMLGVEGAAPQVCLAEIGSKRWKKIAR